MSMIEVDAVPHSWMPICPDGFNRDFIDKKLIV
jgi:hypothetical protein